MVEAGGVEPFDLIAISICYTPSGKRVTKSITLFLLILAPWNSNYGQWEERTEIH
jgi:hypothetical protein